MRGRHYRILVLLLCLPWWGCAAPPRDPYARAEQALARSDLLRALNELDQVPPGHPDYGEARTAAQAIERRMRKCQELVLAGLVLRSEWRDEEAIATFERARSIWPGMVGIDTMIAATRNRIASMQRTASDLVAARQAEQRPPDAVETQPDPWMISTEPVGSPGTGAEVDPAPAPPGGVEPPPAADPGAADPRAPKDEVGPQLAQVQERLARGELEAALDQLELLLTRHPKERRVRSFLARVLNQRGLLRYGQGFLEAALSDWNRVLQLEPKAQHVAEFMAAARTELEARKR